MTLPTAPTVPARVRAGRSTDQRSAIHTPPSKLTETVSVPLDSAADSAAQAARFVRLHAQHCGLSDDRADHLAEVATGLLSVAGEDLVPATFGMADGETRVDLFATFDGPGGMRLGGDSIDAVGTRAAEWGWEPTDSGLRLWACLLRAGATDTGSSPGISDLSPAA